MEKQNKKRPQPDRIQELMSDHKKVTAVIRKAVREALKEHRLAGNPVATLKDGKVVWVDA